MQRVGCGFESRCLRWFVVFFMKGVIVSESGQTETEKELRRALEIFTQIKTGICQEAKGPTDLAPMLHFKLQHMRGFHGMLITQEGDPIVALPGAWHKVLGNGFPEIMMFLTEGYAKKMPKDTAMPQEHIRGEYEQEFKEDPTSDVTEAITMHAMELNSGKQFSGIVLYTYDDAGMPVFAEIETGPCEGPALETRVSQIFDACRAATLLYRENLKTSDA